MPSSSWDQTSPSSNLDGDILANKNRKVPGTSFLLSQSNPKIKHFLSLFPHCPSRQDLDHSTLMPHPQHSYILRERERRDVGRREEAEGCWFPKA